MSSVQGQILLYIIFVILLTYSEKKIHYEIIISDAYTVHGHIVDT